MKFRLKKLLLGKDVALLSEKCSKTTDAIDCLSPSYGQGSTSNKGKTLSERGLVVELYITSNCFKDLDVGYELENNTNDQSHECLCLEKFITPSGYECKSTDVVIEE